MPRLNGRATRWNSKGPLSTSGWDKSGTRRSRPSIGDSWGLGDRVFQSSPPSSGLLPAVADTSVTFGTDNWGCAWSRPCVAA